MKEHLACQAFRVTNLPFGGSTMRPKKESNVLRVPERAEWWRLDSPTGKRTLKQLLSPPGTAGAPPLQCRPGFLGAPTPQQSTETPLLQTSWSELLFTLISNLPRLRLSITGSNSGAWIEIEEVCSFFHAMALQESQGFLESSPKSLLFQINHISLVLPATFQILLLSFLLLMCLKSSVVIPETLCLEWVAMVTVTWPVLLTVSSTYRTYTFSGPPLIVGFVNINRYLYLSTRQSISWRSQS